MQGAEEHSGRAGGAAGTNSWVRAVGGMLGCLWVRWGKHEWVVWDECCRDETDVWHRRDCLCSHARVGSEDVQMWEKSLDISWRDGWYLRFSTSHYSPGLPEICKGFPSIAVRLTSKFDSFFFFFYLSKVCLFELNVELLYCNSQRTVRCLVKPFYSIATVFWQLQSRHVLYLDGLSY